MKRKNFKKNNNKNNKQKKLKRTKKRTVKAFTAKSSVLVNKGAMKTLRIKHMEYVKDILNEGAELDIKSIAIQPGLALSHPWLAAIANRFECYIYNSLSYHYVPAVGTQESGALAFCPDYDASDDNSTSTKQKLLSFEDSVRSPVWSEFTMHCSKSNLHQQKKFYTREGNPNVDTDIRLYDTGNLWIVQSGGPGSEENTVTLGEIWVCYDITFFTPQVEEAQSEITTLKTTNRAYSAPYQYPAIAGKLSDFITQDETLLSSIEPKNGFGLTKAGFYRIIEELETYANYNTGTGRGLFHKGVDKSATNFVNISNYNANSSHNSGKCDSVIKVDNDADADNPYEYYYAGNLTGDIVSLSSSVNRVNEAFFLAALAKQKEKLEQRKQETEKQIVEEEKVKVIKELLSK
jgi:hypothetical protein